MWLLLATLDTEKQANGILQNRGKDRKIGFLTFNMQIGNKIKSFVEPHKQLQKDNGNLNRKKKQFI